MSNLKLSTTNGSVTLKPEDGSGNVDVTIPRAGVGKVLNVVDNIIGQYIISIPTTYANNKNNFFEFSGSAIFYTTIGSNSKIKIEWYSTISSTATSHNYLDIKRNGISLSGSSVDGMYADYMPDNDWVFPVTIVTVDEPNVSAGTNLTYSLWGAQWSGGTIGLNRYSYDSNNTNAHQNGHFIITEIAN